MCQRAGYARDRRVRDALTNLIRKAGSMAETDPVVTHLNTLKGVSCNCAAIVAGFILHKLHGHLPIWDEVVIAQHFYWNSATSEHTRLVPGQSSNSSMSHNSNTDREAMRHIFPVASYIYGSMATEARDLLPVLGSMTASRSTFGIRTCARRTFADVICSHAKGIAARFDQCSRVPSSFIEFPPELGRRIS